MQSITYQGSGERIDTRLTNQFPYSRNFFQHIIERGGVEVTTNGQQRVVKKSYKLQPDDQITIDNLERYLDGGVLEECPAIELDIRLETDDYLVLYKPKVVLSHPNSVRDVQHPSVVGGLYHYFQSQDLPTMGSFVRAGLIHRLDKETDGLMIIAKTEAGLTHFKSLFQRKSESSTIAEKEAVPLRKYYLAVCRVTLLGEGFLEKITDQLPYYIDELVKPQVPHVSEFKQGITKVLSIAEPPSWRLDEILTTPHPSGTPLVRGEISETSSEGLVEIEVEILTGRTHQIRYHLSNHGLPIIGDYLYGVDNGSPMQLTAWKLEFEDLEGKLQEVQL